MTSFWTVPLGVHIGPLTMLFRPSARHGVVDRHEYYSYHLTKSDVDPWSGLRIIVDRWLFFQCGVHARADQWGRSS